MSGNSFRQFRSPHHLFEGQTPVEEQHSGEERHDASIPQFSDQMTIPETPIPDDLYWQAALPTEEIPQLVPKKSQFHPLTSSTWFSAKALNAIAQFEKIATIPIQIFNHKKRLDDLGTIPAEVLRGIEETRYLDNTKIRITGSFFIVVALYYITWLFRVLNTRVLWFSLPFFFATFYTTVLVFITVYNNWYRTMPERIGVHKGYEPTVAVCIPTYGEPIEMLQITLESVLSQNWPHEKLLIVVGDDSHRSLVKDMVEDLQRAYVPARIVYHEPPLRGTPERKGSAKDGNLNAMLAYLTSAHSAVPFVETRDADDIVGDRDFLRCSIGYLLYHPEIAYVQSIKEALVSPGDPFGNRQSFFYRGVMFARNAANAVFPCGSGLIWRKASLDSIDGFPTWNLVEDLYSGYVAMQHGLKGAYLPIVGAIGQVSPEDIPNVYKQLGTWALDTLRIFIWKNPWVVKGLTFKQKMQFTELGLFYLMSFPMLVFILTPVVGLLSDLHPFVASNIDYVLHFWVYAALIELLLVFIGGNSTFEEMWRARQMWLGMIFVYIKASFLAVSYGPKRKPVYKVTRKVQKAGFYLRETLSQIVLFVLLLVAIIVNFASHHDILKYGDLGSAFWACLYMLLLAGIIRRSWFGVKLPTSADILTRLGKK